MNYCLPRHNVVNLRVLLCDSEGLFDNYISQQDYKPKWTAIEPVSKGKNTGINGTVNFVGDRL